ncbi:MAG: hypothetical protein ACI4PO_03865 [Faecousia sp.]
MNGSGCKNCPVKNCITITYRGSTCAAQRAKLGLGDPKTMADWFRSLDDEKMVNAIWCLINAVQQDESFFCQNKKECQDILDVQGKDVPPDWCKNCLLEWIRKPAPAEETKRHSIIFDDRQESGLLEED